ncbi:GAP family protein [Microbacterium murale]|uniref:Membrane protein n=1 Tax=Microbacterium murale TaxID=1081040 RepID=A0ABQ1RTN7_9MICO|nr:GAP family protein [Microbacterium murale]GGD81690.1 membrane protein [Microbacterium murale]
MGPAIGQTLPLALGIAISPVPIIAAVLMLLSPKARTTSVGFLIGWVLGIVLATTVFVLLSNILPGATDTGSKPILGIVQLVLGSGMLFLALRQWRGRPGPGDEPHMPKWMQTVDHISFGGAFGLGALLAGANPKNLLLAASAGATIGSAGLGAGEATVTVAVFTLLAACTVLVPVIGYLVASERLAGPLDALRVWLSMENAVIMSVLLLVLGLVVIGKGISSF